MNWQSIAVNLVDGFVWGFGVSSGVLIALALYKLL